MGNKQSQTYLFLFVDDFLFEFYQSYRKALLTFPDFKNHADLALDKHEFCRQIINGYATRSRQPATHIRVAKKADQEAIRAKLEKIANGSDST